MPPITLPMNLNENRMAAGVVNHKEQHISERNGVLKVCRRQFKNGQTYKASFFPASVTQPLNV